jgi:Uncharacterized conserved protein
MTKEESILAQCGIPEIQQRRYWLVRTDGGTHYTDFTVNDYISIGWDYITREIFRTKKEDEIKALIAKNELIAPTADDDDNDNDDDEKTREGKITSVYNKLKRFIEEIKIGDVVIIPSRNTKQISIGIVESDVIEDPDYVNKYQRENPGTEIHLCSYLKRRVVKWIKAINKEKIDVYLARAFSSHHAISDISEYSSFIDRELYSIYLADGMIHSIIRAGHPNGVSFKELQELLDILDDTLKESSKISGIRYDPKELQVKLNIHSPGLIELIGFLGSGALLAIGMFAWNHIKNGGETKFNLEFDKLKVSSESKSPGIEGRRNERLKIEYDHQIQELKIEQEERLLELSQSLQMTIPEVSTVDNILTIPEDDAPKNNLGA